MKHHLFNRPVRRVEVEGHTYLLKRLSWAQQVEMESAKDRPLYILCHALVDEGGTPLFGSPDELRDIDSSLALALVNHYYDFAYITKQDQELLEKN